MEVDFNPSSNQDLNPRSILDLSGNTINVGANNLNSKLDSNDGESNSHLKERIESLESEVNEVCIFNLHVINYFEPHQLSNAAQSFFENWFY